MVYKDESITLREKMWVAVNPERETDFVTTGQEGYTTKKMKALSLLINRLGDAPLRAVLRGDADCPRTIWKRLQSLGMRLPRKRSSLQWLPILQTKLWCLGEMR